MILSAYGGDGVLPTYSENVLTLYITMPFYTLWCGHLIWAEHKLHKRAEENIWL
jgi:hypothetical protein